MSLLFLVTTAFIQGSLLGTIHWSLTGSPVGTHVKSRDWLPPRTCQKSVIFDFQKPLQPDSEDTLKVLDSTQAESREMNGSHALESLLGTISHPFMCAHC